MKRLIVATLFAVTMLASVVPSVAAGDVWVDGYFRSDGTYVRGYYRTRPNSTVYDNYSYYGNYNPYTGAYGTRRYSYSYSYPSYSDSYSSYRYSYPSYSSFSRFSYSSGW